MMDRNFKDFQTSMETTQKTSLSHSSQKLRKTFSAHISLKRYGYEAKYRGNAQVMTKLREADDSLDRNNITMETINGARAKIGEGI